MNPELTPTILAELRGELETKRDTLQQTIAALRVDENSDATPATDSSTDATGDHGDASVDSEEWDENHQEQLDLEEQLAEVEHALEKFPLATYGMCEDGDHPIPLARLRAIPEARYTVEHQREKESPNH